MRGDMRERRGEKGRIGENKGGGAFMYSRIGSAHECIWRHVLWVGEGETP